MQLPLVDAATMADLLDVSEGMILSLAREGKIPVVRISTRTLRFQPARVLEQFDVEIAEDELFRWITQSR